MTHKSADKRGRESFVDRLENYLLEGVGDLSALKEELAMQLADARFVGDDTGTNALEQLLALLEKDSMPEPGDVLPRIFALREADEFDGGGVSNTQDGFVSFDIPLEDNVKKMVGEEGRLLLRQAENQGKKLYYLEVNVSGECRNRVLDCIESEFVVIRSEMPHDGERLCAIIVTDRAPRLSHLLSDALPEDCSQVESHIKEIPFRELLKPRSVARRWYEQVPPVSVTPSFEIIDRILVLLREVGRYNDGLDGPLWRELADDIVQYFSINLRTVFEQMQPALVELGNELKKKVMIQVIGDTSGVSAAYAATLREHIFELLENAIRHGIESPEERKRLEKAEAGTIRVIVSQRPQRLAIRVRDDGRGVDREKIRIAFSGSIERGLARLRHVLQEQYGGKLSLRTGERGTTVEIDIPYGPEMYRALVFRRRRETFAVPAALVTEIRPINSGNQIIHDAAETSYIRVDGRALPYRDVTSNGDISEQVHSAGSSRHALVITAGGYEIALAADEIVRETQVIPDEKNPTLLHAENIDPPPVAVKLSTAMRG